MSTAANLVEAKPRQASDKNAARRLRRTGAIPAVLYGAGKEVGPILVVFLELEIRLDQALQNFIAVRTQGFRSRKALFQPRSGQPQKGGEAAACNRLQKHGRTGARQVQVKF